MTALGGEHLEPLLADRVDTWLPDLDQLPFGRGQVSKLLRVIQHRRNRLTSS